MSKIKFISAFLLLFTMVTFTSCENEPIDSAIDLDDFNNGGNNGGIPGVFTASIGADSFSAQSIIADYSDSALETLCATCHQDFHDNNKVPVYTKDGLRIDVDICTRCNGSGWFFEYRHVDNGRCFKCHGQRFYLK